MVHFGQRTFSIEGSGNCSIFRRSPGFYAIRQYCSPDGLHPEIKTMRALPAAMMLLLITIPALAVSPKVEDAIKIFQAVVTDANKLKTFCELLDLDEELGDKQDPVIEAQMDKLLDQLGAEFEAAWDIVEDTDERSPDGRALNAALDQLEDKCPD
jgi:hypothetical protein